MFKNEGKIRQWSIGIFTIGLLFINKIYYNSTFVNVWMIIGLFLIIFSLFLILKFEKIKEKLMKFDFSILVTILFVSSLISAANLVLNYHLANKEIVIKKYKIDSSRNFSSRRQRGTTTSFQINYEGLDKNIFVGEGYSVHKDEYKYIRLEVSKGLFFDVIKAGKPMK